SSCFKSGRVTTTNDWPWVNPALGACLARSSIRSTTSGGTGSSVKCRTIRRFRTTSLNSTAASFGLLCSRIQYAPVSVLIRGRVNATVGATLVVALLVDHQYRGRRAGLVVA